MASDELKSTEAVKFCMQCHQSFRGRLQVCPQDGTLLVPKEQSNQLVGSILAERYEVLSVCGKGGMGTVYKARHLLIDRIVAIKMLKADLLFDEQSVKRFQLEARAASRLAHPNVVTIHDFGVSDPGGQPYLVMDYIEGESLADIIKADGRVPARRAVPIFIQVCSALEHAHRQHIVHRDIKPSNIVLVKTDELLDFVKVVDFGIAKLASLPGQESLHLTKTGETFGSPIYMSPEQCQGMALDGRSDIYSLGATMYETLAGFPPLVGKTLVETMDKQVNEQPLAFQANCPDLRVPDGLEQIIMKSLEKEKDLRYQSMLELKEALELQLKQIGTHGDDAPAAAASRLRGSQGRSRAGKAGAVQPDGLARIDALRKAAGHPGPLLPVTLSIVVAVIVAIAGLGWYAWSNMLGMRVKAEVFFLQDDAGGYVRLLTLPGRNLLRMSFQALDRKKLLLAGKNGAANGAIWDVTCHKGDNGLVLEQAAFTGKFDDTVQAADELVRHFYVSLSARKYSRAYSYLSPARRKREPYKKFCAAAAQTHYLEESADAPVQAVKVAEQYEDMIKLLVNLKWFTGDFDHYVRITSRRVGRRWSIDNIEPIGRDEWESL